MVGEEAAEGEKGAGGGKTLAHIVKNRQSSMLEERVKSI